MVASVLYLHWLTRKVSDPATRHQLRDDDAYMLTDAEAKALTPTVRRLIDLVPGGTGARAVVQIGEHLSVLFVLLSYSERTAPLREAARDGRPARPSRTQAVRSTAPTTTGGNPVGQHQSQDGGAAGSVPAGPAIGPGVIGSQYSS